MFVSFVCFRVHLNLFFLLPCLSLLLLSFSLLHRSLIWSHSSTRRRINSCRRNKSFFLSFFPSYSNICWLKSLPSLIPFKFLINSSFFILFFLLIALLCKSKAGMNHRPSSFCLLPVFSITTEKERIKQLSSLPNEELIRMKRFEKEDKSLSIFCASPFNCKFFLSFFLSFFALTRQLKAAFSEKEAQREKEGKISLFFFSFFEEVLKEIVS